MQDDTYDVVICGGGLAGLTLARQLRMAMEDLRILVLEKAAGDLPDAAHKVGESSVEVGAHYFLERLGLKEYFASNQLPKFGLRFFFKNTTGPLQERMELGARQYPRFPSAQIDRGVFERDLRDMARGMGVDLIDEAAVKAIDLASGEDDHTVTYATASDAEPKTVRCRWVVDAMGRRRFLQSKLGLKLDNGHKVSAAWWRMAGKYDISDMVEDRSHSWHDETKEERWFSTNHFMGVGYWVWVIPLSSQNTSIGIVTDEKLHPVKTYNTYDKARTWLAKHEPQLLEFMGDDEPLDFLCLKNYSYLSKQLYSVDRWTCVGEAGMFLDPFYSPGSDYIAYANSFTTKMIELDLAGELTEEIVSKFNRYMLEDVSQNFLRIYRDQYPVFGSSYVMATKVTWDTCYYWAFPGQMFFRKFLIEPDLLDEFHELSQQFLVLNERVQEIFNLWAKNERPASDYHYVEYGGMPFFRGLHFDLGTEKTPEKCFADMRKNLRQFEEWALVIFEHALRDVAPEHLDQLPKPLWLNPYAISLDPAKWLADGLFKAPTPSRTTDNLAAQMRSALCRPEMRASG